MATFSGRVQEESTTPPGASRGQLREWAELYAKVPLNSKLPATLAFWESPSGSFPCWSLASLSDLPVGPRCWARLVRRHGFDRENLKVELRGQFRELRIVKRPEHEGI